MAVYPRTPNAYANKVAIAVYCPPRKFCNRFDLKKYIEVYIYLWGMSGDIAISLIQRDFQAYHIGFVCGKIPHKCGKL